MVTRSDHNMGNKHGHVPPSGYQAATFAGGCFWGLELVYQRTPGVLSTQVGYTGGHSNAKDPTYTDVCSGGTGHAEAVMLLYDPSVIEYKSLVNVLLDRIDPTAWHRQGFDVGSQYRSAIYFHTEEQQAVAYAMKEHVTKQLNAGTYPGDTIGSTWQVEIEPAADFWPAEEYHQQYLAKGGRFGRKQSTAKQCTDPVRCYG